MENKSIYLKKNVGYIDRIIRITLGIIFISGPVFMNWSPWSIAILAALGGSQILEGIIGY